jgi:protein-L-isoaspartate O-methyltransferase
MGEVDWSMTADLNAYRQSAREQDRLCDLMRLMPCGLTSVLEIGARDGYMSRRLGDLFKRVTALDLEKPSFDDTRIETVKGDVRNLQFPDGSFDVVLCAEVLEHISPESLPTACQELARVARVAVLIGVPYRQDIRRRRTSCYRCGNVNPPWGHVNTFDEKKLVSLFGGMQVDELSYVGSTRERANWISTRLMDWAGNPYGTYDQEEPCIHCGACLLAPRSRTTFQKVLAKCAVWIERFHCRLVRPRARWIHICFVKQSA